MIMSQEPNNGSYCNTTQNLIVSLTEIIVYVPVFFFGLFVNAFALWIFCYRLGKWTETRIYMTNLALSDCLFVFTLPLKLIYRTEGVTISCLILECAYFINRYTSIFLITITAVDRYIAIRYPLQAKNIRSPVKSAVACGIIWTLMISILCATKMLERQERGMCFRRGEKQLSVSLFTSVIWGFLIPLTILSFCSIEVTKKLKKKKKSHQNEARLIQKAIHIIRANMTVFIICFLPLHVAIFVRFAANYANASCANRDKIDIFLDFAVILANTNCCLDAICYYFVNKEFQEASMEITSKYQSSEQEISDIF